MRIHVPSLPHTETTREYDWCAYTAKVRRFCDMMTGQGHEVYLYGGEENEALCKEHVVVVHREEQQSWWPGWDPDADYWPDGWAVDADWWRVMNHRTIAEIMVRSQPGDYLGIIAGFCQQQIADALPKLMPVEWGIGYKGVFAQHKAFESYAWMHHIYGREHREHGHFFDAVIPNSFHTDELLFEAEKDDYLLYIGRMIPEKGLSIVGELARAGHVVKTAGQGDERVPNAEHLGVVRGAEKAELFAKARAVLVPTLYVEPFGGVAVEAMLSGTPVITTDWGAFTETVVSGLSGFRCRLMREFLAAADMVQGLDPVRIQHYAQSRFSTEVVAHQYNHWFSRLDTLWGEGWTST